MWEWALFNYNQDIEDQNDLIKRVFEMVQPWLNLEMYSEIQKREKEIKSPAFVSMVNELRAKGMSQEDIEQFLKDAGTDQEEFDTIEKVVSPWTNVTKEDLNG